MYHIIITDLSDGSIPVSTVADCIVGAAGNADKGRTTNFALVDPDSSVLQKTLNTVRDTVDEITLDYTYYLVETTEVR